MTDESLGNALRVDGKNIQLSLHIQTNAKIPGLVGLHGGSIKLKVGARPIDGAANQEVIEILATVFKVSKSKIKIIRGELSKSKLVEIKDLSLGEAADRLRAQIE